MYGYACRYLSREEIHADFAAAMALIRASVDRESRYWLGAAAVSGRKRETYDPLPEGLSSAGMRKTSCCMNLYPGEDRLAETSAGGRPGVNQWGYTALYAKEALATTTVCFWWG